MPSTSKTLPTLERLLRAELYPFVRNPGWYVGGERNAVVKDLSAVDVRFAFCFPDTYTIGMSHLGMQILYKVLNDRPDTACERVFSPWVDAEAVMRAKGIPLFTLESKARVRDFDILGFSLQYEVLFAQVLATLDLAGIPLRSDDRDETHPLVIAGGPCAENPEPLAPFVDLFLIGDGEEALPAFVDAFKELKAAGADRRTMIAELARRFDFCYAPSLYDVVRHADGTQAGLMPRLAGLPRVVRKAHISDFGDAPYPDRPVVGNTQTIHDRIMIEIMRGCPQGCRFCHAGFSKRPVRWRSVEQIVNIAKEMYRNTGHQEISLVSLSSSDYPHLQELIHAMHREFNRHYVNISLPSLRVDDQLKELPSLMGDVRKSGLTIAPEVASDRLRKAIHKRVTNQNLFDGTRAAFASGFQRVKMYFMVGLPTETDEDILEIVNLSKQVSFLRKQMGKSPAPVTASVSLFVPKPHTSFQYAAQASAEYMEHARRLLWDANTRSPVKLKIHKAPRSLLESVLSRGDRRVAEVIEHAVRREGVRFDAWDETFDASKWDRSFEAVGLDPAEFRRERAATEYLPWSHISIGKLDAAWFEKDYNRSRSVPLPLLSAGGSNGHGHEHSHGHDHDHGDGHEDAVEMIAPGARAGATTVIPLPLAGGEG